MSNEPENRTQDTQVSDAYRALAQERVPDHLNERVLRMAAKNRTEYARARSWMRPAAWAATIGLSLAIVLELTQLPSMDTDYSDATSTVDSDATKVREATSDESAARDRATVPESPSPESAERTDSRIDNDSERQSTPTANVADKPLREALAPQESTVMQDAQALARSQTGTDKLPDGALAEADGTLAELPMADPMSAEAAAMRHAEADLLAARKVSVEARGAAASLAAVSEADTSEQSCPASERETADAWLACIRELRESGQDEQADGEYEEFRQVFPDFDDSITDK